MTTDQFISFAESFGYGIRFTGIGMAYLTLEDRILSEAKDIHEVKKDLALLGMAIMNDILRAMPSEAFKE